MYISYDLEVSSIHIVKNSGAKINVEMKKCIFDEESKFGGN